MTYLTPTIAGVPLPFCLMNAAGALSTSREELLALAHSESGAVVTKSITTAPFEDPGARCGLENPGYAAYVEWLPEILRAGKPVIASVAGFSVAEYIEVAQALARAGASLIEMNLNDPHVHKHLNPFRSAVFLSETVAAVRRAVTAPLAVKLPPTLPLPLAEVAAALLEAAVPAAICHNASADRWSVAGPHRSARLGRKTRCDWGRQRVHDGRGVCGAAQWDRSDSDGLGRGQRRRGCVYPAQTRDACRQPAARL